MYGSDLGAHARLHWPAQPGIDVQVVLAASEQAAEATRFLVRAALAQCHAWPDERAIAIDMAPASLTSDLRTLVADALSFYDVAPERFTLCVREDDLNHAALPCLISLRELGARIRLADIGRGGCPLGVLSEFCPDEFYLSSALYTNAADSRPRAAMVRTVAELARRLGATLGASGVADSGTAEFLKAAGCTALEGEWHRAQGA